MEIKIFRIHSKLIEIAWPKVISDATLNEQKLVKAFLEAEYGEGIREIRMGFNTISLKLRIEISAADCIDLLSEIKEIPQTGRSGSIKIWQIPVCYNLEFGRDLESLAELHQMDKNEIVKIHAESLYTLHFYGFLPGFMYLGGLSNRLFTPRKRTPDRSIPSGTVAIGGKQTGIYPMESPGGWHAIGRCPVRIFDISKKIPVVPEVGDKIKFIPVHKDTFDDLHALSSQGKYSFQYD